jgi:2-haloacid dehalogenase
MHLRGIAFDLYGTLVDSTSVERACRAVTDRPEELASRWRTTRLEYTWLRSLMSRYEDFWTITSDALDHVLAGMGVDVDVGDRERLMEAWLHLSPFPEVPLALKVLSERTPLAVLSNGSPAMLEAVLRQPGLGDRFEHRLSADAVQTYKPGRRVYALAEQAFGVPRTHILFVSANGWDVAGAGAFGLPAAFVNRSGRPVENLGIAPTVTMEDLSGIVDIAAS